MTNQTRFKEETKKLYNSIKDYIRDYSPIESRTDSLQEAANTLRSFLTIVNTDEEETKQKRSDSMC